MNTRNKSYHFIYFLLWPFLTLVHYIINFREPAAKNVMWLFITFYGLTFAIGVENADSDIVRYVANVEMFYKLNFSLNEAVDYYLDSREIDVFRTFSSWGLSKITSNGFYLIVMYGVIYGYFFSRNIWYTLDRLQGKIKPFVLILIITLFLIIPIWNLNGFRFWTASHTFIYGLLPFIFEKKRKSLIWCFVTPFILHFSFLFALLPLVLYLLLGNKVRVYFYLFLLSFFISEFDISQFNTFIEQYLPDSIVERSSAYRVEDKILEQREGGKLNDAVWYVKIYGKALRWSIISLLVFIYWKARRTINRNKYLLRLLSFIFLYFFFANILSTIPSGSRFLSVGNFIAISALALYLQNNKIKKMFYSLSKAATPFLIFYIIITLRIGLYSLSIMTFIGNPFIAFFTLGDNISVNDILKGL